jgi:hypothetical protein
MKQKFFFCINISKFESEKDTSNIDNNNCHEFGCIPKAVKHIKLDADPGMHLTKIVDSHSPPDPILRSNLLLLQKILHVLEKIVDEFEEQEKRRFRDEINGFIELKEFVKLTIPNDENIDNFVDWEIEIRNNAIRRARPFKSDIINLLINVNYRKDDAKKIIEEKINSLEFGKLDYVNTNWKKIFLSDVFKKTLLSVLKEQ